MKSRTIALQVICCALGALFVFAELVATKKVTEGGLFFGWLFFFFASILGADHTANRNAKSRRVFKSLVLISAVPFVALSTYLLIHASDASPLAMLAQGGKIILFSVCIAAIAADGHPRIQRVLKKCGISVSNDECSR